MIMVMKTSQQFLAVFLISLFCLFSFNAYACILPGFPSTPLTQSDCTKPGEEPVSQFCDGFKTLAVYSNHDAPSTSQVHVPFIGDLAWLHPDLVNTRHDFFPLDDQKHLFEKDILLRIAVFRI